jgi:hypothetical protein
MEREYGPRTRVIIPCRGQCEEARAMSVRVRDPKTAMSAIASAPHPALGVDW